MACGTGLEAGRSSGAALGNTHPETKEVTTPDRECIQCGAQYSSEIPSELCPVCTSAATLSDTAASSVLAGEPTAGRDASTPQTSPLRAGAVVGRGRFRLERPLGRGGLGEVWLAEDMQLSQSGDEVVVALKFLKEQIRNDVRRLAEFRREVERSRKLAHPNLVRIHDWHETEGEPVFYSMEYVEGLTLQQLQTSQPDRRLSWAQLRPLAIQLCEALHYAHTSHGLVHSDLKPANVMVDDQGGVKLGDFGMARRVAMVDGQWIAEVRRGGTRAYMSPQQFRGEPALLSDDIYSLGATLFHLLTGTLPIPDGAAFALRLDTTVPPTVLESLTAQGMASDVPPAVVQVIRHCLEKQPEQRPGSVREALRRLSPQVSLAGSSLPLVSVSDGTGLADRRRLRRPWGQDLREWLALVAVLAGLVWGGLRLWNEYGPPSKPGLPAGNDNPPVVISNERVEATPPPRIVPPPTEGAVELVLNAPPAKGPIHWRIVSPETLEEKASGTNPANSRQVVELPPGSWMVQMGTGEPSAKTWVSGAVQVIRGTTCSFTADWRLGSHKILVPRVPGLEIVRIDPFDPGHPVPIVDSNFQLGIEPSRDDRPWGSAKGAERLPGFITYRVKAPYHRTVETNVFLSPGARDSVVVVDLIPSKVPMRGLSFTCSSIGLRFQPVGGTGGFWAAETETTVGQFSKWVAADGAAGGSGVRVTTAHGQQPSGRRWNAAVTDQTEAHPVVGVTWSEAIDFASWLTQRERQAGRLTESQRFTLPTSVQWAALAGTRRYTWGNEPSPRGRENLAGEEARQGDWPRQWTVFPPVDHQDSFPRTSPVGSFPANENGLYDVGGNVSEWCLDSYVPSLNSKEALDADPDLAQVPAGEVYRVVCGGNWSDDHPPDLLRELKRRRAENDRNDWTGFRLVLAEEGGTTP